MINESVVGDIESPVKILVNSPNMVGSATSGQTSSTLERSGEEESARSRSSTSSLSSSSNCGSITGTFFSRNYHEPPSSVVALANSGQPGTLASLYNTPLIGYEVMEERTRFTVFKLWVESKNLDDGWFVFRRYTDFLRLNKKLKALYPGLGLSLPPKKWFGDNFDPLFLEDRLLGLQAYITNITNHPEICNELCVKEFFCLDSKPASQDSIEESRAMCHTLNKKLHTLKRKLKEKDTEMHRLKAELALMKTQQDTLVKGLKLECSVTAFTQNCCSTSTTNVSSSTCDTNVNNILGIHNVNVKLLHMLGSSRIDDDKSENMSTNNYNASTLSEISNNKPHPAVKGVAKLNLSDDAMCETNKKDYISRGSGQQSEKYLKSSNLDSPTSSDSGFREEMLSAINPNNERCKPKNLPIANYT